MRKPLPDQTLYQPLFSPWLNGDGEFAGLLAELTPYTLVSPDKVWMLIRWPAKLCCYPVVSRNAAFTWAARR